MQDPDRNFFVQGLEQDLESAVYTKYQGVSNIISNTVTVRMTFRSQAKLRQDSRNRVAGVSRKSNIQSFPNIPDTQPDLAGTKDFRTRNDENHFHGEEKASDFLRISIAQDFPFRGNDKKPTLDLFISHSASQMRQVLQSIDFSLPMPNHALSVRAQAPASRFVRDSRNKGLRPTPP
uniref:Uncharacterized protein n=1 Tax=Candidatus Kentrum sp. LFY TaxID=2126342 RepID=A0A450U588_9GAMM|nr:MAG: hypothetical protein BECKLFY1418B_GA0070995_100296 [Candidatus Kentron sp. LFY]